MHDMSDMQELATLLQEAKDTPMKLIASDGIFSMDGSITPLRYVCVCVCTVEPQYNNEHSTPKNSQP